MTRSDSTANPPLGIKIARVDYDDEESLVSALRDQQFLIITLGARVPSEVHSKIVQAALKARVAYIMPNVYGFDPYNVPAEIAHMYGSRYVGYMDEIEKGGASYIVMSCGFWYEWSLATGEQWFGFDFKDRKVTLFDDGQGRINVSTWQQCGRALAALLSLPVDGASPSLSDWKNKQFFLSSFKVSQRDMLDSVNRVMQTTDKDWEITRQPVSQRLEDGFEKLQNGQFFGFPKVLYGAYWISGANKEHDSKHELINGVLGLPKEDLDTQTKVAVDMVESGWNPFGA